MKKKIREVIKNGKKYYCPYFMCLILAEESNTYVYSINKKQGNAVFRNRCRRRLKEAVRQNFLTQNNYTILFRINRSIYNAPWIEILKSIKELENFISKLK